MDVKSQDILNKLKDDIVKTVRKQLLINWNLPFNLREERQNKKKTWSLNVTETKKRGYNFKEWSINVNLW